MISKNLIVRLLVGFFLTVVLLLGLNKLLGLDTEYNELILTGIMIVGIGQIVFKVITPYKFPA